MGDDKPVKTKIVVITAAILFFLLSSSMFGFITLTAGNNFSNSVDWWPMINHDPSNTGYSNSTGPPTNNTLWTYGNDDSRWSPAAISNGVVYVGGSDKNIHALNASTGASIWLHTAGIVGSPAVCSGIVYLALVNETVCAFNASTGELIWSYNSDQLHDSALAIADWTSDIITSSPLIYDGILYVTSGDGNVFALNATRGSLIWDYLVYGAVTSPAVSNGFVYFSSQPMGSNATFHALNAATGIQVWDLNLGFWDVSSPVVAYGMVYVSSKTSTPLGFGPPPEGKFFALNATSGNIVWSINSIETQPTLANGIVYVDNEAYDALVGTRIKSYETEDAGQFLNPPIIAGDTLYINVVSSLMPPYGGKTFAFNITSGNLLWNYSFNETHGSSFAIANGILYVSSLPGKFYAIGLEPPQFPTPTIAPTPPLTQILNSDWKKTSLIVVVIVAAITLLFVSLLWRKNHRHTGSTLHFI